MKKGLIWNLSKVLDPSFLSFIPPSSFADRSIFFFLEYQSTVSFSSLDFDEPWSTFIAFN